jgi:hypothetical protein
VKAPRSRHRYFTRSPRSSPTCTACAGDELERTATREEARTAVR